MVSTINQIVYQLFQKESLEEVSENELRYFIRQYPYAGTGHLLLAKKMQLTGEKRAFERETNVASVYFNNPAWLQFILQDQGDDINPPKAPATNPEPVSLPEIQPVHPSEIEKSIEPADELEEEDTETESQEIQPAEEPVIVSPDEVVKESSGAELQAPGSEIKGLGADAPLFYDDFETSDHRSPVPGYENAQTAVPEISTPDNNVCGGIPVEANTVSNQGDEIIVTKRNDDVEVAKSDNDTAAQVTDDISATQQNNGTDLEEKPGLSASQDSNGIPAGLTDDNNPSDDLPELSKSDDSHSVNPQGAFLINSTADTQPATGDTANEAPAPALNTASTDIVEPYPAVTNDEWSAGANTLQSAFTPDETSAPLEQTDRDPASTLSSIPQVQDSIGESRVAHDPAPVAHTNAEGATINQQEPTATGQPKPMEFDPYHTIDYFASQGIKLKMEELSRDKLGQQLKSFTEWIRSMKRLPQQGAEQALNDNDQHSIRRIAEHSVEEKEVLTESMAEVWVKQGNYEKARQIYRKLSLQNPSKSTYFAAKIDQLKVL